MENQNNSWRPNWKDKTQYPMPNDDILIEQWAWEFLRRNEEYQKDYNQKFCDLPPLKKQKDNWIKYGPIINELQKFFAQKYGISYPVEPSKKFSKHIKFERQSLQPRACNVPFLSSKNSIKYALNYGETII